MTPLGRFFRGRYLQSRNSAGATKLGVGNISPRGFRRHIVRHWHPLGCGAIELGKPPPQGGVITTVLRPTGLPSSTDELPSDTAVGMPLLSGYCSTAVFYNLRQNRFRHVVALSRLFIFLFLSSFFAILTHAAHWLSDGKHTNGVVIKCDSLIPTVVGYVVVHRGKLL